MQNFLAIRDSPIIPYRQLSYNKVTVVQGYLIKLHSSYLHKPMERPLEELVIHMNMMTHSRHPQYSRGISSSGTTRITRSPTIDGTWSRFSSVWSLMSCRTPRPLESTRCVTQSVSSNTLYNIYCKGWQFWSETSFCWHDIISTLYYNKIQFHVNQLISDKIVTLGLCVCLDG